MVSECLTGGPLLLSGSAGLRADLKPPTGLEWIGPGAGRETLFKFPKDDSFQGYLEVGVG